MAAINAPILFLLISSFICAFNAQHVPVLMWRSTEGLEVQRIPALHILKEPEFKHIVEEHIDATKSVIFMFIADELSTKTLACRSDGVTCFTGISQIRGKTYLPAVNNPIEALANSTDSSEDLYVTTTGDLSQDITNPDQKLYKIFLPNRFQDETYEAYHMRLDRIVIELTEKLKKISEDTLCIFTGLKSSVQLHSRKVREAQAPEQQVNQPKAAEGKVLSSPNLLVYYTEVNDIKKSGEKVVVTNVTLTGITVKTASDSNLVIQLTSDSNFNLEILVNNALSYWFVKNVTLNGREARGKESILAPANSSFKCSPALRYRVVNTTDEQKFVIKGLQIQPRFGSQTTNLNRFSDAVDCVGFTSVGIWAGLFVTFLLLFIMSIGITWIMDIRTMDRFDDPKGKTITINVNE